MTQASRVRAGTQAQALSGEEQFVRSELIAYLLKIGGDKVNEADSLALPMSVIAPATIKTFGIPKLTKNPSSLTNSDRGGILRSARGPNTYDGDDDDDGDGGGDTAVPATDFRALLRLPNLLANPE
jgi:hypothetical protein